MKHLTRAAAAAFITASALSAGAALAAEDPAFGYWLVESKRAIVEIGACDGAPAEACGKIVWMLEPLDEAGAPKTDVKNEDPALQSRPLCGLPIIGDFEKTAPGEWEDGFIYDASEGDLYDAYMEMQDDGSLKVRGFVGVSLLGKSQIWTRETDARGGC